jgi:hypothetical protein
MRKMLALILVLALTPLFPALAEEAAPTPTLSPEEWARQVVGKTLP